MQRLLTCTLSLVILSTALKAEDAGKAADATKKEEKITYVDHVLPVFRARCGSCHNANDRRGGLVLDQYAAMMTGGSSGAVIEPGDGEFSYLWLLVNHEDTPKMPPNADKLPEAELALIKKWIDQGALENSGSVANIKKKASLAKIEVSTERPAEIAMPLAYLGEPVHVLEASNAVTALATSPWAPILAVSGYQQIGLYDSRTLESLGTLPFPEGQPQILKFSRNGALLIAGGGRGGQVGNVVVYDVKTGERKTVVGNEYDEVLAADISPDQSLIALGGPKKMLRVYSTATGELVYENKKHTDWVTAIEFSPDGVLLASADRSNGLIIWEAESGNLFYDLQGHKGAITDVSWRPDSNVVGSASEDGTVKLWEMINGGNIKSWNAHSGGVSALDYTREGNLVSIGRDKVARLWNGDGGKLKDFGGFQDIGMEVAYDAETKRTFGGDWTGKILAFNSDDATKVGEIDTNPPTVAMTLSSLEPKLEAAKVDHAAKVKSLNDLNKAITDRKAAADQAVAAANQAKEKATQLLAQKQKAEADLKAKETMLAQTNQLVASTKTAADQVTAAAQKIQGELAVAKTKMDQQLAKVNQVKAAANAAAEGVAKATQTLMFQTEAAKPTPDELAVIEKDPAVKAAVEKRAELVKQAEAQLTFAKVLVAQTAAGLTEVEKSLAVLTQAYQTANAAGVEANKKSMLAAADYAAAVQAQKVASQGVETSKAALASLVQAEKVAVAEMVTTKANADKLVAAATPTAEEQKAIEAAQTAANAAAANLKALEEKVNQLKAVQAQVAKATAQAE